MPIYVYQCPKCLEIVEKIRTIAKRDLRVKCPTTGCKGRCKRNISLEQCSRFGQDWAHPVLSQRMGVSPEQADAHRKAFPKIPMTDTGEIVVNNASEERRINKELASIFSRR